MKLSILVVAVVVALGTTASLVLGHVGDDAIGTIKSDVGASLSSRGATVAGVVYLPGAPRTMQASDATMTRATGDSRLNNYRLERESCCIGNEVVEDADLRGASRTMHVSEAAMTLATNDSRLNNYRLERESCCIGND